MEVQLRRAILASVLLFLVTSTNYRVSFFSEPSRPTELAVAVEKERLPSLTERQSRLAQRSLAHALQALTDIPLVQAQEVVTAVREELLNHGDGDYDHYLLVLAVIVVESSGDAQALSPKGARGLMQIMPPTGRFIAAQLAEEWAGSRSLFETQRNVRYGIWYLDHLRTVFPENQQAVLAAYNWGPDHIQSRLARKQRLPEIYPRQVRVAQARLKEEMYDFYRTHYWRSLDLSQDSPSFGDHAR